MHSVFNGIMIAGAARWGYDPIWIKKGIEPSEVQKQSGKKVDEYLQSLSVCEAIPPQPKYDYQFVADHSTLIQYNYFDNSSGSIT